MPNEHAAAEWSGGIRILSVVASYPRWSESFIVRKAAALALLEHRVVICARQHEEPDPSADLPPGVALHCLLPDCNPMRLRVLPPLVRRALYLVIRHPVESLLLLCRCVSDPRTRRRPFVHFIRHLSFTEIRGDVIHLEFLDLGITYPLLRRLTGTPVVVSSRGADLHFIYQQSPRRQAAARECLLGADAVHCVSQEMADCVERFCGRTSGVWVNRPAVQPPPAVERRHRSSDPPRILAAGRLVWKKGFDCLLEAAFILYTSGIPFRLRILGEGPDRANLEALIRKFGIADVVELAGAVHPNAVAGYLGESDLFVLSSREEGISNAVLEAMAWELPVITTCAGGMTEAVTDGVEGYVVPVDDSRALAGAMERLLRDPAKRRQMGRYARQRVTAEFSLSRQAAQFEEMYRSVIASTGEVSDA